MQQSNIQPKFQSNIQPTISLDIKITSLKDKSVNIIDNSLSKNKLNFSPALTKSIDESNYNFINFFSSNAASLYIEVKRIYDLSLNDDFDIDKYFSSHDYHDSGKIKNTRLNQLIFTTNNNNLSEEDLLKLVKYKHRDTKYKGFQLFIKDGKVYLIDLYHLIIPTKDSRTTQRSSDSLQLYQRMQNKVKNKCCLSTINSKQSLIFLSSNEK